MQISILGLGWLGGVLGEELNSTYKVVGTSRNPEKLQLSSEIKVYPLNYPELLGPPLYNSEVFILNISPFEEELTWFKSWNLNPNAWMIFLSSTSEKEILLEQEAWVQNHFTKWTILRLGGLIGEDRHPGKILSGRKNLPGRLWPVNLIHRKDIISFIKLILEKNLSGEVFHVVSSHHPTREEYYTNYCLKNDLPVPEFDPLDNSKKLSVSSEVMNQYFKAEKI